MSLDPGAIEYARREGCVQDSRAAPFRWEDIKLATRKDHREATKDTMLEIQWLQSSQLPVGGGMLGILDVDTIDNLDPSWLSGPASFPMSLIGPGNCPIRSLKLDISLIDLGPDTMRDVEIHHQTVTASRSLDISQTWLPRSMSWDKRDGGLEFPGTSERLYALLWWQILHDGVSASNEAKSILDPIEKQRKGECHTSLRHTDLPDLLILRDLCEDIILPSLRPVSVLTSPKARNLIPNNVDLTSDFDSPLRLSKNKQQDLSLNGYNKSSPSLVGSTSPSSLESAQADVSCPFYKKTKDTKSIISQDERASSLRHLIPAELATNSGKILPEESSVAIEIILSTPNLREDCLPQTSREESPKAIWSDIKLPLPTLGTGIPGSGAVPALQDRQKLQEYQNHFHLPREEDQTQMDADLNWCPIPQGKGRMSFSEQIPVLDHRSWSLLQIQPASTATSKPPIMSLKTLLCLQNICDADYEAEPEQKSCALMPHDRQPTEPPVAIAQDKLQNISVELTKQAEPTNSNIAYLLENTGDLLSNFMSLRGVKRPRSTASASDTVVTQHSESNKIARSSEAYQSEDQKPAPYPEFPREYEKNFLIVSYTLQLDIMQHLCKIWPQDHLIDRDYSRHESLRTANSEFQTEKSCSIPCEADISISPSCGLLIATLLQVKQRPLPGSNRLSPLRERVKEFGLRYETPIVLVSQRNPNGEFLSDMIASDWAAYADFVCFVASLSAGIVVLAVPGASQTLAKWITRLIIKHSTKTKAYKTYLQPRQSTWEVLLRKLGMNSFAAQVVAGRLYDEHGKAGLTIFLTMSSQERIDTYKHLLGGEKVLRQCNVALQNKWS